MSSQSFGSSIFGEDMGFDETLALAGDHLDLGPKQYPAGMGSQSGNSTQSTVLEDSDDAAETSRADSDQEVYDKWEAGHRALLEHPSLLDSSQSDGDTLEAAAPLKESGKADKVFEVENEDIVPSSQPQDDYKFPLPAPRTSRDRIRAPLRRRKRRSALLKREDSHVSDSEPSREFEDESEDFRVEPIKANGNPCIGTGERDTFSDSEQGSSGGQKEQNMTSPATEPNHLNESRHPHERNKRKRRTRLDSLEHSRKRQHLTECSD